MPVVIESNVNAGGDRENVKAGGDRDQRECRW